MGGVRHAARKPLAAWSLTGSALVVLAAALVLTGLNASLLNAGRICFYGLLSVGARGATVGAGRIGRPAKGVPCQRDRWLLADRLPSPWPSHRTVRPYAVAKAPGSVPAAEVADLSVRLRDRAYREPGHVRPRAVFPDGRLPSRRWRPVLWARPSWRPGGRAAGRGRDRWLSGGIIDALDGAGGLLPEPAGGPSAARLVQRPPGGDLSSSPSSPAARGGRGMSCRRRARAPNAASSWPGSATSAR